MARRDPYASLRAYVSPEDEDFISGVTQGAASDPYSILASYTSNRKSGDFFGDTEDEEKRRKEEEENKKDTRNLFQRIWDQANVLDSGRSFNTATPSEEQARRSVLDQAQDIPANLARGTVSTANLAAEGIGDTIDLARYGAGRLTGNDEAAEAALRRGLRNNYTDEGQGLFGVGAGSLAGEDFSRMSAGDVARGAAGIGLETASEVLPFGRGYQLATAARAGQRGANIARGAVEGAASAGVGDLGAQLAEGDGFDLGRAAESAAFGGALGGLGGAIGSRAANRRAEAEVRARDEFNRPLDEAADAAARGLEAEDRFNATRPDTARALPAVSQSRFMELDDQIADVDARIAELESNPNVLSSDPDNLTALAGEPAGNARITNEGTIDQRSGRGVGVFGETSGSQIATPRSAEARQLMQERTRLLEERSNLTAQSMQENLAADTRMAVTGRPEVEPGTDTPPAPTPPPTTITKNEVSDVVQNVLDGVETPQKVNAAYATFELPQLVLRKMGLESLADKVGNQILEFKRANYDNLGRVDEWKVGTKDKTADLWKAADGDEAAYNALSPNGKNAVDQWRIAAREWADELGLPEDSRISEYIPHMFVKEGRAGIAKLTRVEERIAKLEQQLAEATDDATKKKINAQIKRANTDREKLFDNNSLENQQFLKDTGAVNPGFLKRRTGAEGARQDFWRAVESYVLQKNRKIHIEPVSKDIVDIADKAFSEKDFSQKWLQSYSQQLRGIQSNIDRAFDAATRGHGTTAVRRGRNVMSLAKLGFSANSVVNSTAQLINLAPVLGAKAATRGNLEAISLLGKLSKNKLTGQETEMIKKMYRDGVFEGASQMLPEETFRKYGNRFNKAAFSGIMAVDRYMRMAAYLGARHTGEAKGLSGNKLDAYAVEMSNKVNQNFDQIVAPTAFRSQVARSLGSLVTFVPGQLVRAGEIGANAVRGGGRLASGKSISQKTIKQDADKIARALYLAGSAYMMGEAIGAVTGQDETIPNIFNADTWSTPAIGFLFGSGSQEGLLGLLPSDSDQEGDHNDRIASFFTETLPGYTVPGWSQLRRSSQATDTFNQGGSYTDSGQLRFPIEDTGRNRLQGTVFGQWATPEGQEYLDQGTKPLSDKQTEMVDEFSDFVDRQAIYNYMVMLRDIPSSKNDVGSQVKSAMESGDFARAQRLAEEHNQQIRDLNRQLRDVIGEVPEDLQDYIRNNYMVNYNYYYNRAT